MTRTTPFPPEMRECAVRMVRDHEGEYGSQSGVAAKIRASGFPAGALRATTDWLANFKSAILVRAW